MNRYIMCSWIVQLLVFYYSIDDFYDCDVCVYVNVCVCLCLCIDISGDGNGLLVNSPITNVFYMEKEQSTLVAHTFTHTFLVLRFVHWAHSLPDMHTHARKYMHVEVFVLCAERKGTTNTKHIAVNLYVLYSCLCVSM